MNNLAYFEIQASNPKLLADFYSAIFGWEYTLDSSMPIEYYRIATNGMWWGILSRPATIPPMECGTNAFTCSMQVENFDQIASKILEHGWQIAMPKFAIPGKCRQWYFVDPDHNVFGIFETDEQAK